LIEYTAVVTLYCMAEAPKPEFFCPVCQTGFVERDIEEGRAVRRGNEVLCLAHFREKYPGECLAHPGVKADHTCVSCGWKVCKDCLVELEGKDYCKDCKPGKLEEMAASRTPFAREISKSYRAIFIVFIILLFVSILGILFEEEGSLLSRLFAVVFVAGSVGGITVIVWLCGAAIRAKKRQHNDSRPE